MLLSAEVLSWDKAMLENKQVTGGPAANTHLIYTKFEVAVKFHPSFYICAAYGLLLEVKETSVRDAQGLRRR